MPYSIMLDAGHGGKDPGAVSAGRQEKDDTLRLTLMVGEILQDRGVDVEYTRTTDIYEWITLFPFTEILPRMKKDRPEWRVWSTISPG